MTEELENKWRMECLNPYNVDNPEAALSYYIYQAAYVTGRYDSQKELETTKKLLGLYKEETDCLGRIFKDYEMQGLSSMTIEYLSARISMLKDNLAKLSKEGE